MILSNGKNKLDSLPEQEKRVRTILFWIANLFLLFGVLTYLFLYPDKFKTLTLLGFQLINVPKINIGNGLFLSIIYAFTSFSHVVFMSIYSALLSKKMNSRTVILWALFWAIVDSIFEFGQAQVHSSISYFKNGVYDNADLMAIWIGVTVVIALWLLIQRGEALNR